MDRISLYTSLKGILQELYPNLIVLKSLRNGESDPNLQGDVDVYCIIQEHRQRNLHIPQGPQMIETETGHNLVTYQNKRVMVQFDFFGKDESNALNVANECNQWLAERLVRTPQAYNFSLLGMVGDVINNSNLSYGRDYNCRYTFRLDLFVVDAVGGRCVCERIPEHLRLQDEVIAK